MSALLAASAGDEATNTIWALLVVIAAAALLLGKPKGPKR